MRRFGLIGKKLSHSFSQKYFTQKFKELGLNDHIYDFHELASIDEINLVFSLENLKGLNITVPYKESVIPYLDQIDESAKKIGAVNVIKIHNGQKIGFNSDFIGFRNSLINWLPNSFNSTAIILGTGGASKAVQCALDDLNIPFETISRTPKNDQLDYHEANKIIENTQLIINTTPLGMSPNFNSCPDLDYQLISSKHYLYDLVYNPEETLFLSKGKSKGASVKNGLEMLHLQAEESWNIWNKK